MGKKTFFGFALDLWNFFFFFFLSLVASFGFGAFHRLYGFGIWVSYPCGLTGNVLNLYWFDIRIMSPL